jgi:hypothetical protein
MQFCTLYRIRFFVREVCLDKIALNVEPGSSSLTLSPPFYTESEVSFGMVLGKLATDWTANVGLRECSRLSLQPIATG